MAGGMKRTLLAGPLAFLVALAAGCAPEDLLHRGAVANKAIDTSAYPAARPEASARVHELGEALVGQNPFLGVSTVFYVVGRKEPEVYHADGNGLLVTEGLVDACRSDDELSAVLALELGRMSAEARTSKRLRLSDAPVTPAGSAANGSPGSGPDDVQLRTEAIFEQSNSSKAGPKKPPANEDAAAIAAEILQNANVDRKHLAVARTLLAESRRGTPIADQMNPKPVPPRWSRGSND